MPERHNIHPPLAVTMAPLLEAAASLMPIISPVPFTLFTMLVVDDVLRLQVLDLDLFAFPVWLQNADAFCPFV
jgi:hypothetical protein